MLNGTLEEAAAIAKPDLVWQLCTRITGLADRAAAGDAAAMTDLVRIWEDVATLPDQTTLVSMSRCLVVGMLTVSVMQPAAKGGMPKAPRPND